MKMISCIAIEDEPHALQLLEHYAKQVPFLNWRGGFQLPLAALPQLNSGGVDLLFLDINLTQLNGISFYRSLTNKPRVIFTTAFAEYAVESYSLEAIDYLVKPILFERFVQACNKAQSSSTVGVAPPPDKTENQETIYLKSGSKWFQLMWSEISYLEKSENYVIFQMADGRKILSRQNLGDVEQTMPSFFCRIHKSFIVNLKRIEVIEREKVTVRGQSIALADSYREALMKRVGI
jgi:two-component system, LytTR family, response regulator